ncbi:hypothetical protein D3OALGA1CA_2601 [Olavius algarvensis associated proteobacterium Delta 3]|nr:hypothetical protein D3OALGA1CA_2601 [Olavius algarvensis associated proteobacterium Delta 3]CAB5145705.1 hypothetical protein D3OALGB2SA_4491 [Olavius algarvensis associated proteobacterium Delta 3]
MESRRAFPVRLEHMHDKANNAGGAVTEPVGPAEGTLTLPVSSVM